MAKIILAIIAVVILMAMFPLVLSSTHEIQTETQTDAGRTLSGEGPWTFTLTEDLWQDDKDNILSVTGDKPETLTVTDYAPTTNTVTVTGVTTSTAATAVYEVEGLKQYTGMGALVGFTPLLIWIGVILSILGGLFLWAKGKFGGE